jgi:lipopolysaccharide transport system ATP-binding protein
VDVRSPVRVEVEFWNLRPEARAHVSLQFFDDVGTCLFATNDFVSDAWKRGPRPAGAVRSVCRIPGNLLAEGLVRVSAGLGSLRGAVQLHAFEGDAVAFTVVDCSEGDGVRGPYSGPWPGVVRPMLEWALEPARPGGE